ncbi:unnamed protein product [Pseudo-nitzschia multistriata]|uniref:Uncharacterized protein n=1 Tax=Pseudo-nitzschia multistriata TaxID=183589 RepID=A0A448ZK74_9STRA|nr:unnamed protein product [Pseudo-nitzschia multistriata]
MAHDLAELRYLEFWADRILLQKSTSSSAAASFWHNPAQSWEMAVIKRESVPIASSSGQWRHKKPTGVFTSKTLVAEAAPPMASSSGQWRHKKLSGPLKSTAWLPVM